MTSRNQIAEAQNLERARDADKALVAYVRVKECMKIECLEDSRSGQDLREWLTDLLSDLRHWARINDVDFDKSADLSRAHFNAEFDEEYEDDDEENEHENEDQANPPQAGAPGQSRQGRPRTPSA